METSKLLWRQRSKMLGGNLWWTSILSRGSRNTPSRCMPQKPERRRWWASGLTNYDWGRLYLYFCLTEPNFEFLYVVLTFFPCIKACSVEKNQKENSRLFPFSKSLDASSENWLTKNNLVFFNVFWWSIQSCIYLRDEQTVLISVLLSVIHDSSQSRFGLFWPQNRCILDSYLPWSTGELFNEKSWPQRL